MLSSPVTPAERFTYVRVDQLKAANSCSSNSVVTAMTYMRTALAHRHQLVVVLDDTPSSSVLHLSKRNEPRKLADYFTQDGRHRRGAPSLYHGHTVRSRLWRPSRCRDAGNHPRAKCKEQTTGNAGGTVQNENCITKALGM